MVGVELPGEDQLPAGPKRDLVLALHDLYQGAGRPSLRRISEEIKHDNRYSDTVSHEAAGAMLRGQGVPRWAKLECLVYLLAVKHHPPLDPDDQVNRFLTLWNALSPPRMPEQQGWRIDALASHFHETNHPNGDPPQGSRTITLQSKHAPVPAIWGDVPFSNINFTGRADLLVEIEGRCIAATGGAKSLALYGIIGAGKTQLAVEYAHRYRSHYQVIWWISADQIPLILSSLALLAIRLGVVEPSPKNGIEEPARMALEALRRGEPYSNWLLIFDNPTHPEDVLDLLPRGTGNALITSRSPRWREMVDAIRVGTFRRSESVDFLKRAAYGALERPDDDRLAEDADRLAEELGDLPLALAQAADSITTTGISAAQYRRFLSDRPSALLGENKPSGYPVPITAAWLIANQAVEHMQPQGRQLLGLLSFFGSRPIPLEILRVRPLADDSPMSDQPVVSIFSLLADPIAQGRAIRAIIEYGLADVDSIHGTIQVHCLVQLLIREKSVTDSTAQKFQHAVHVLLTQVAPTDPRDEDAWPRFALLAEHLKQCSIAECADPDVRSFALHMAQYLHLSGDNASSLALTESLIEHWTPGTEDAGSEIPEVLEARRLHTELIPVLKSASGPEDTAVS